jgi:hypothetical protein
VTDVLKLHPGNEDVLDRCATCLKYLAYDAATAEQIADEGGVEAVLASIDANPDLPPESVSMGLGMIEAIMGNAKAFAKICDQNLVDKIMSILNKYMTNPTIALSCMKVLEKVAKTEDGLSMIHQSSGVKNLLASLNAAAEQEIHGEEDADLVMRATKVLGRVARTGDIIREIKAENGVDIYLKVLDSFPDDERIARLGGKFLTRITGDSIEELIAILKEKGVSAAMLERTLALLASLAIDGNSMEDIVNNGGVVALVDALESGLLGGKSLESTCKAIARIAANARNIAALVEAGAIDALVNTLSADGATSDSKAQAIDALCKIASHSQYTDAVVNANSIPAVVAALASDPENGNLASACLKFFATLQKANFDMEVIAATPGAIEGVIKAMLANPGNQPLQENGTTVLCGFSNTANAESNVQTIVRCGAVPIAIANVQDYAENIELLKSSMVLLTHMLLVKEGEVAVREGGGIDAIVGSVMMHPDNDEVRKAAMELVELLSSDELVQQMVDGLKKFIDGEMKQSDYMKVPVMAMCLGTLAMIPENVQRIMQFGGVPPMIALMGMVAGMGSCVAQEEILGALAGALRQIIGNVENVSDIADVDALLNSTLAIPENHPKMENAVSQAFALLVRTIQMCPDQDYTDYAVVEQLVTGLRSNLESKSVTTNGLEGLLLMSKALGGAHIAKKNGARICVQVLDKNAGNDDMVPSMATAVKIIEIVAGTDEGKDALIKQGAVNAIFAVMDEHSSDENLMVECRRAIGKLVTADEVLNTLYELGQFSAEDIQSGTPAVEECVKRLGLMLLCGDFSAVITENGGIDLLVNIMSNASLMKDGVAKQNLIAACVAAFGRAAAAGNADVGGCVSIVPIIVQALVENPTIDTLQALTALARDPTVCRELVNQGAVEALLPIISNSDTDAEMMSAASVALGALAQDAEGARRIVQGGGLKYITDYITETEGASVVASVNLLNNLVDNCDVDTIIKEGVLDAVADTLFKMTETDVEGLTAVLHLLTKIGQSQAGAQAILDKGLPGTLVSVINSSDAYTKSGPAMKAFAELLKTIGAVEGAAEHLQTVGVGDVLIKAMNALGNDTEAVSACAKALGAIGGGGASGLYAMMEQVAALIQKMEAGDTSAMGDFTRNMQVVSNLMLEEGAVDQEMANYMMDQLNRAISALRNFDSNSEQQDAMAICLTALSRLAAIESIIIDAGAAVGMCSGNFGESTLVIESACAALGSIACVSGGISAIAGQGMIATIQTAASGKGQVGKIGASGMAMQAAKALEVISEQAVSQAVSLVGTEGGAKAIAQILKNIDDERALATTLEQICQQGGGLEALLDALVALGPPDFGGNVVTVDAIIKSLINARDINGLYTQVTTADQIAALTGAYAINGDAIILMETAAEFLDGIKWMANTDGCFDALISSLTAENVTAAQMAASIFSKCIAVNDEEVMAKLKEAGVANSLLMALKDPRNLADEIFTQNALYSLRTMADLIGIAEMGIGKEGLKIIQDGTYAHSQHQYILDTSAALLAHMTQAFAGGTEALLEDKLRNLANLHAGASMWQQVVGEDGSAYFYNSESGESSWEQAASHLQMQLELDSIISLMDSLDGNLKDLDITTATSLIGILGTHAQDAGIMQRVVSIMSSLCATNDSAAALASAGNISDLINAMKFHIGDADLMEKSVDILDSMSNFAHLKESLSSYEYIETINNAIWNHITVEKLVIKGTRVLHQLSTDNAVVIGYEMQVKVEETMKNALIGFPEKKAVYVEAFWCLGNLLQGEEENRLLVCNACCDEIIFALGKWHDDEELLEIMLKAVGNISLDDDAIITMVEKQCTKAIVNAMEKHPANEEILKLAVMVISNFGAINDEEKDAYATDFIIKEGGTIAVKNCMETHPDSVGIVEAAMEALFNLGNDIEAAVDLAQLGVMELTMKSIQKFDYEPDLLSWAIKFLSVFTYAEVTLDRFADLNGCEVLLKVMQNRIEDEQFLHDSSLTLSNALVSERNREAVEKCSGVPILLQTMDLYNHNPDLVKFIISALNRLCTNDDVSLVVAEQGMHVFMKAVQANLEDTTLLSLIFELFGQLAFVKANIKLIVQHGGIKIFLQMMEVFGDDEELMCQTLNTLDNVVSADEEYAAIMVERQGEEKINAVLEIHAGVTRVEHAGKATLLSMTAMSKVKEQVGSKISRGALFARLGSEFVEMSGDKHKKVGDREPAPEGDPLAEHRNLLRNGSLLKVYTNGSKAHRHIFVARDWGSIWVKDTSSTSKQARRIQLSKLRGVERGYGPGHMKSGFGGKSKSGAKEECSFYLDSLSDNNKLAIECANLAERDAWFTAIELFLKVARLWPEKLADS